MVFVKYPDECCPACCMRSKCCDTLINSKAGQRWWTFRCYMYKLVEHKYFETFIIIMICASSLALVSALRFAKGPFTQCDSDGNKALSRLNEIIDAH